MSPQPARALFLVLLVSLFEAGSLGAYDPNAAGLEVYDIGWDNTLSVGTLLRGTWVQMFRPARAPWRYTTLYVGVYVLAVANPYVGEIVAYPCTTNDSPQGPGVPRTPQAYSMPLSFNLAQSGPQLLEIGVNYTVESPGPVFLGVRFQTHDNFLIMGSGYNIAAGRPAFWMDQGSSTWQRLYDGARSSASVAALVLRAVGVPASTIAPPAGWACPPEWYGDGVCHCTCTKFDVDCNNRSAISNCPAGQVCDWSTGSSVCLSTGWNASVAGCEDRHWFAGDGCHICSATTVDPDCEDSSAPVFCLGVPGTSVNGNGKLPCTKQWTCPVDDFQDGSTCNCGCGMVDPDCTDLRSQRPTGLPTVGCADSNMTCGFRSGECWLPRGWTCPVGQYDNMWGNMAACHCGCGAYDADCDSPRNSYTSSTFPIVGCEGSLLFPECSYQGTCISAGCPNGHVDRRYLAKYESCDGGLGCSDTCQCSTGYVSTNKSGCAARCGDGLVVPPEECDGDNCDPTTCHCLPGYVVAQNGLDCTPVCGDGVYKSGEECDGGVFCNNQTCKCISPAAAYSPPRAYCRGCGNQILDSGEDCDGGASCNATTCACTTGFVKDSTGCVQAAKKKGEEKERGGSAGAIIGGIVGGVGGLLLLSAVILVVVLVVRKRRKHSSNDVPLVYDSAMRQHVSSMALSPGNPTIAETSLAPPSNSIGNSAGSSPTATGSTGVGTVILPPPLSPGEVFDPVKENSTLASENSKFRVSASKLVFAPNGEQATVGMKYVEPFSIQNTRKNTKMTFRLFPQNTNKYTVLFEPESGIIRPGHEYVVKAAFQLHCTAVIKDSLALLVSYVKKTPDGRQEIVKEHTYIPMDVTGKLSTRIDYDELQIRTPPVGEGAYGTVYRGTWRGNDVAIKELKLSLLEYDTTATADFLHEIEILEHLPSSYVVHFYGAVLTAKKACLITEFCELGSLGHLMRRNNLTFPERCRYLLDCASGMRFLHASGIIHRDLKPDNLLVVSRNMDEKVVCKITDFGTAKGNANVLNRTAGIGTPIYMSPEILDSDSRSKGYTAKADVYSFGVMLWELFAQQEPYLALNFTQPWEVTKFVLSGQRLEIPPDCPKAYAELISRCWDPNPSLRPEFEEIVAKLELILKDAKEIERLSKGGADGALSPGRGADVLSKTAPKDGGHKSNSHGHDRNMQTTTPAHHHHRHKSRRSRSFKTPTSRNNELDNNSAAASAVQQPHHSPSPHHGTHSGRSNSPHSPSPAV